MCFEGASGTAVDFETPANFGARMSRGWFGADVKSLALMGCCIAAPEPFWRATIDVKGLVTFCSFNTG